MAVSISRAGNTATVTVTVDTRNVIQAEMTPEQRRVAILRASREQLARSLQVSGTDAEIDAAYAAKATELVAERDRIKAARASGGV